LKQRTLPNFREQREPLEQVASVEVEYFDSVLLDRIAAFRLIVLELKRNDQVSGYPARQK
jgi:hypothetical protein